MTVSQQRTRGGNVENKDPIKIEPVEFVAPVDDVYNPLIGGWEQKAPIVTRGEVITCVVLVLIVVVLFGWLYRG